MEAGIWRGCGIFMLEDSQNLTRLNWEQRALSRSGLGEVGSWGKMTPRDSMQPVLVFDLVVSEL